VHVFAGHSIIYGENEASGGNVEAGEVIGHVEVGASAGSNMLNYSGQVS